MKCVPGLFAAILCALAVLPATAQTTAAPPTLNDLKLEFDIVRAELLKPVSELDDLYGAQLEKLRLDSQSRGRLEEVLAIRSESARLEGGAPDPKAVDFPELVRLREIYQKTKSDRLRVMNRALLPAIAKQKTQLEALRTIQTRENRIDEAISTQKELDRLLALEAATRKELEAPAATTPTLATTGAGSVPAATALKVRVQVDGIGHLHLRGHEIWYDHTRGRASAPGRHEGEHPTFLNDKTEWRPVWTGSVTQRHAAGIALPVEGTPAEVHVRQSGGRGHVVVLQQPTETNDFTAILELRDQTKEGRAFNGSDWLEFRVSW
ncbi:MAG: hypothetical protein JNJ70_08340 [Verrucomicrobiales bacterium]|nr:hypothetical protein [Verrucomicrobiales bacterium]